MKELVRKEYHCAAVTCPVGNALTLVQHGATTLFYLYLIPGLLFLVAGIISWLKAPKNIPMAWPTPYTGAVLIGLLGAFYFTMHGISDMPDSVYSNTTDYKVELGIAGIFTLLMLWGAITDYRRRPC